MASSSSFLISSCFRPIPVPIPPKLFINPISSSSSSSFSYSSSISVSTILNRKTIISKNPASSFINTASTNNCTRSSSTSSNIIGSAESSSEDEKSNKDESSSSSSSSSSDSSQILSALLPLVVAATAVSALVHPPTFSWVSKKYYAPALGGIMLSIGIRLSFDDFALAVKRPLPLSVGFLAQYVLKPLIGVLIASACGVPTMFYAGFVLTSCVAGAQLSSYASFLSKGDVALSILLTSSTTIASVLVTPILTGLLIGSVVPVDAVAMSKSILQVVLVPIVLGLALNTYAKPVVCILQPVMPFVAMICTSLCIGSPLAINQSQILSTEGLQLVLPVVLFHAVAFTAGYWVSKIPVFRQEEGVCRTISLCTGMQSSTLAGLLASQFLGSSQAVPPACSVVTMAIMGLCLASFWGNGHRIRDISRIFLPQAGPTVEGLVN